MKIKECVLIEPFICMESDNIIDVAKKLRKTTLRHIFVVNNDQYPTGVISVLDMNNRVVAQNRDLSATTAKEIMSPLARVVDIEDDLNGTATFMMENHHVMNAVVREGKMFGIITLNQLIERGGTRQ